MRTDLGCASPADCAVGTTTNPADVLSGFITIRDYNAFYNADFYYTGELQKLIK